MIKFFRHFRQQLLGENKFGKYLKYAIGEIVLVVIGILIALQINNWNEFRKDRQLEDEYLHKIALNISDDINQYENILSVQKVYRSGIDSFLQIIRNPLDHQVDELDQYYSQLWQFERFTPNKGALDNLNSSGKINLIQNDELLNMILNYYKVIEEQSVSVDEAISVYSRNQIGPYFMNFDFMDSKVLTSEHRKRKSLLEYHRDPAMENLISARLIMMDIQERYYNRQIGNARDLIDLINKELKK